MGGRNTLPSIEKNNWKEKKQKINTIENIGLKKLNEIHKMKKNGSMVIKILMKGSNKGVSQMCCENKIGNSIFSG